MKPEDLNDMNTLRLNSTDNVLHPNGRAVNRGDGGSAGIEGWGVTKVTALTAEEQLELAVDLDNLEEKLRFASDGDKDREMLQRWVDRLCQ